MKQKLEKSKEESKMRNTAKGTQGITLIALVITIIVLLILAGVTIAMLSGENGILSRATETRATNAEAQADEQAKLAYMGVRTEIIAERVINASYSAKAHTGDLVTKVKSDLDPKNTGKPWTVNSATEGTITMTFVDTSLNTTDHQIEYKIELPDATSQKVTLYKNEVEMTSGGSGGSGSGDTEDDSTKTAVTELREGDEVVYTDKDGNEIPCIVLYDSTGSYGIQIISKDTVGDNIELGNGTGSSSYSTNSTHFATAKESYNTAIAKLNKEAIDGYLNTNLATNARCVGSSPSETPITSEDDTGTYTNTYSYFSSPTNYNNQFKPASANNTESTNEDYLQMIKSNINCCSISESYWLASRNVSASSNYSYFSVCRVLLSGDIAGAGVCRVGSKDGSCSSSCAYGLRPIFLLKSDIHYVEESGTKKLVQ